MRIKYILVINNKNKIICLVSKFTHVHLPSVKIPLNADAINTNRR